MDYYDTWRQWRGVCEHQKVLQRVRSEKLKGIIILQEQDSLFSSFSLTRLKFVYLRNRMLDYTLILFYKKWKTDSKKKKEKGKLT